MFYCIVLYYIFTFTKHTYKLNTMILANPTHVRNYHDNWLNSTRAKNLKNFFFCKSDQETSKNISTTHTEIFKNNRIDFNVIDTFTGKLRNRGDIFKCAKTRKIRSFHSNNKRYRFPVSWSRHSYFQLSNDVFKI